MQNPLLVLLCSCLSCLVPAFAEERPEVDGRQFIIVGGDFNYPPYEYLDKEGKPAGFNVELTRAVAQVMDLRVDIRLGEWDVMRHALRDGTVDVLEGMSFSTDRSKVFDFSIPHCTIHQSIFARRGSPPVSFLSDLAGKEVAVQRGGIMQDLMANSGTESRLILVDTHADALRLIASGRLDYALVNTLTGVYFGLERGLTNVAPVGLPVAEMSYGFAVKKGNHELLQEFDQGLQILINTGRYQQIHDKWLGILEPRPNPWPKVIKYGAAAVVTLLAILGSIVIWSWSLRKKIDAYIADSQIRQEELLQAGKMASLGILVSGVAHEINNPTGLILYNLPLLRNAYRVTESELEARFQESGDFSIGGLKYSELREEIPRMFDEMQGGANRIKHIVEDLKDFARKDTSSLKEIIDLNTIVQTSVRLLDSSIRKATSRFQADYMDSLPMIRGNAHRIEQVVVNLLLNACQALENPEQGIHLSTSFDLDQKTVVLTIRDEGIGIPPEHLANLTDPFFTTKRESGGTGLGLSVSAGIVKDHQGKLEFQSAPGEGTTAILTLPVLERG
jgi:polar amino acid transport system substrate-binding protein